MWACSQQLPCNQVFSLTKLFLTYTLFHVRREYLYFFVKQIVMYKLYINVIDLTCINSELSPQKCVISTQVHHKMMFSNMDDVLFFVSLQKTDMSDMLKGIGIFSMGLHLMPRLFRQKYMYNRMI